VLDVPTEWSVPGFIELADAEPQDEPKAAFQIAKSREQARAAFKKGESDTMLRLPARSDDPFRLRCG
jgi:hypothetical protein